MARQMLALCDTNIHYGSRLVDYLEEQKGFPYSVMYFSDIGQLRAYEEKCQQYENGQEMGYLILSEELLPYLADDTNVRKVFLLTKKREGEESAGSGKPADSRAGIEKPADNRAGTEKPADSCAETEKFVNICAKPPKSADSCAAGRENRQSPQVIPIYRYQPAGNIMRAILGNLEQEEAVRKSGGKLTGTGMKIIGVYTPTGRCMQTSFSMLLGQILTRQKRTLYLNMEGFSGFRVLLGRSLKPDITDLMYLAEHDRERFMARLEHMIDTVGGLEYIPPASTFMDLSAVSEEQWIRLFRELEADGRFGYLILDLTEHVQGLFHILQQCDLIYTIESDDAVGNAKIQEYERMLDMMEYTDVVRKTRKKRLPKLHRADIGFDQLIYSELAAYVQQLVKEDFEFESV